MDRNEDPRFGLHSLRWCAESGLNVVPIEDRQFPLAPTCPDAVCRDGFGWGLPLAKMTGVSDAC
jgi:hypothetical protein